MTTSTFKKWLHLGFALFCLWVVVFILAPALLSVGMFNTMRNHIEANSINATAMYYTDSPEFNGADIRLHDAIKIQQ
jgi:hypothetical protein